MFNSIYEVQKRFNSLLLDGVGYNILNNPLLSWENGFIKTVTAICLLISIVGVAGKIADHRLFLTSLLKLSFMFVLVLMNFGQIDPRGVFDVGIKGTKYDYLNRAEPESSKEMKGSFDGPSKKLVPTLDREIFNGLQKYFDEVSLLIGSYTDNTDGKTQVFSMSLQEKAITSTLFFLAQVKYARKECAMNINTDAYSPCLKKYIPLSAPVFKNGKPEAPLCQGKPCTSEGENSIKDGEGGATSSGDAKSLVLKLLMPGIMDGLTKIVEFLMGFVSILVAVLSDILFALLFPTILAVLELLRVMVSIYIYIIYGFQAVALLIFAKIMSPMILLDKQRGEVIKAYQNVFALTLFGFVSQLFVFFTTVLSLGLRDATYQAIAPSLVGGKLAGNDVDFTASLGTMSILVYTTVFVILIIQIQAMSKIIPACKALMNFSITQFVNIGEQLGEAAAKMAVKGSAALVGGAALAATGVGVMAAKGLGGAAMKGSMGKTVQGLAAKGKTITDKAQRGIRSAGGGITDTFAGSEAGDKFRHIFGGGGTKVGGGGDGGGSLLKKDAGSPKDMSNLRDGDKNESKKTNDKKSDDDSSTKSGASRRLKKDGSGGGSDGGSNKSGGNSTESKKGDRSDPFSSSSKEYNKDFKSDVRKPGFLGNSFVKGALGGAKKGLNAVSGVMGIVEDGASGNLGTGSFTKGFGKEAMGNKIAGAYQEKVVNAANKKLDGINEDKAMMRDIQNHNLSIDNVSADQKFAAQSGLADTIKGQNYKEMSTKDRLEFNQLVEQGSSGAKMSEEDSDRMYNLSQNYEMGAEGSSSYKEMMGKNKDLSKNFASRKAAEQEKMREYELSSTAQNASNLSQAISSGQVSVSTLKANEAKLNKTVSSKTASALSGMKKSMSEIDMSRIGEEDYGNSYAVQNARKQSQGILGNSQTRASVMGKDNAKMLGDMGVLSGDEVNSLTKLDNEEKVMDSLKSFQGSVQDVVRSRRLDLGNGSMLQFDSNMKSIGVFSGNNKISEKITTSGASAIMSSKISEYKDALAVMNDNPERFQHIRDEDKVLMQEIINQFS